MRVTLVLLAALLPVLAFAQSASPIKRTNPPTLSAPTGYTHVVEVTGPVRTIYIAGQIPYDKDGKIVGQGDMRAQTEQVFKNLEAALAAAGAKFSDVVKLNTYVTDLTDVAAIREVRARYFGATTPASTLVRVAGFGRPEMLIEIEVIAVLPIR